MSASEGVTEDLLAKGLTRSTQILKVPTNLAVLNVGVFAVLFIFFVAFSFPVAALIGVLLMMCASHLVLMILSAQDDKGVLVGLTDAVVCKEALSSRLGVAQYSPLHDKQRIKAKRGVLDFVRYLNFAPLKTQEVGQSKHIPYSRLVSPDTVITKRGALVQVIAIDGINASTAGGANLDMFKETRNRFFYQVANPRLALHAYLLKSEDFEYPAGEFSNDYAKKIDSLYQKSLDEKKLYKSKLYLALVLKPNVQLKSKKGKKDNGQCAAESHLSLLKELNEVSAKALSMFHRFGPKKLTTDISTLESELLSFLGQLINNKPMRVVAPSQSLDTFLSTTKLEFSRSHGVVKASNGSGQRYMAELCIKEYPEETAAGMLDILGSLDSELMAAQSFVFASKEKAKKLLQSQQKKMMQTDESESLIEQINTSVDELGAGRLAFGEHSLSIRVYAASLKELDKKVSLLESELNEASALIVTREYRGVDLAYWGNLPGNENYLVRGAPISTQNLASLASFHNQPSGKLRGNHWGDALTTLQTAHNTRYHLSLHVKEVANSIILGTMGSGKTAMQSMLLGMMSKVGGWRFIFDKDRGMEIIVRALGGHYQLIRPGKPSNMAPLQLEKNEENIAFNILLIKQILSSKGELSANDEKKIESAVSGIYELEKGDRTFSNLAPFLGVSTPNSLRERFDRWCGEGNNAWLFDNEVDAFDISNKLSGIDLGDLLADGFSEVSTPLLMYLFHRIGALLDGAPSAVFIPEGWRTFSSPQFRRQLDDWSRTPRKNNLALIMDTQSPTELAESKAGLSVAREAVTQIFFGDSKANIKDYSAFNLTDSEFHIIQEVLPQLGGFFFLLKQGGVSLIARCDLSGLSDEIAIISSKKVQVKLLDRVRAIVGDEFANWREPYLALYQVLKTQYLSREKDFFERFEQLWEEYL